MSSEGAARKLVFLSHSHKDVELANSLKEDSEWRFAINVFVAHQDLTPSEEWQIEILKTLRRCDAFIALLTRNFARSDWTDQETGLAFAFRKVIIPIRIDVNPYGFVGRLQALKWDKADTTSGVDRVAQVLFQKRILSTDELIGCFKRSRNFDDAGFKARILRDADRLSKRQINEIAHAAIQNEQIYGASSAKTPLRTLFKQHSQSIDSRTKKVLKRLSLIN
jgi:hypothetical protein